MMFEDIAFIDTEVEKDKIQRVGLLLDKDNIDKNDISLQELLKYCNELKFDFVCGHNFVNHDRHYMQNNDESFIDLLNTKCIIDTLYLSVLLAPNIITHRLDKPYKTNINIENCPLEDCRQTNILLWHLDGKFDSLDENLKNIFVELLYDNTYFKGYFVYKKIRKKDINLLDTINDVFCNKRKINLTKQNFGEYTADEKTAIAFSFALSYIYIANTNKFTSTDSRIISPFIMREYPQTRDIIKTLRNNITNLDNFAKEEFDIAKFRTFKTQGQNSEISQRDIIECALNGDSILSILPTGGGKTLTFQIPALIKAREYKALSIVISPLLALMKDQVDNFKNANFHVVAINSFLNIIERANTLNNIKNGVVDLLYIAPESLRNKSLIKALKLRYIERIIIDEAHCISSWGHDFRHSYFFINDTIKELEEQQGSSISVSCFTATAKPNVIKEIEEYFEKLGKRLKAFIANSERTNLHYFAYKINKTLNVDAKYKTLFDLIIENRKISTLIYIPQNAKLCEELRNKLSQDIFALNIEAFYAKLDDRLKSNNNTSSRRNKKAVLRDFIDNNVDVVIATTAFGMGIDKPDIESVIHYESSDSLEAYMQESGRGARDETLEAKCHILYQESDIDRIFRIIHKTKINHSEINNIAKELKKRLKYKNKIYVSHRDIAKGLKFNTEDADDYRTIVDTSLLELAKVGIIKYDRDTTVYATSIKKTKSKSRMKEVRETIEACMYIDEITRAMMIRIMQNIIQKSKEKTIISVDDLADMLGEETKNIEQALYELKKCKLIDFEGDIEIFAEKSIIKDLKKYFELEEFILKYINEALYDKKIRKVDIRILKEKALDKKYVSKKYDVNNFKHIIKHMGIWINNYTANANKYKFKCGFKKDICFIEYDNINDVQELLSVRNEICNFIAEHILDKLNQLMRKNDQVEISIENIKLELEQKQANLIAPITKKITKEMIDYCFVYMQDILKHETFEIKSGRLIYRTQYKITKGDKWDERVEKREIYTKTDYNKNIGLYYKHKIAGVHILMKYIELLCEKNNIQAANLARDYFTINYEEFIRKYKFDKKYLERPMTFSKYKEIIENLNEEQKAIFEDKTTKRILVLAGPGSGKTKTLVHKIASAVMIENCKPQYLLMLAHSRSVVMEFRNRLFGFIGNLAYEVRIHTFHSFALELLGQRANRDEENFNNVIIDATEMINNDEISLPYTEMLVLDEYQDVGEYLYGFINAICNKIDGCRIIAVGDDDQCIGRYGDDEKQNANVKFIRQFKEDAKKSGQTFKEYSLLANYRSLRRIVDIANVYRAQIPNSLKSGELKANKSEEGGVCISYYQYDREHIISAIAKTIIDEIKNTQNNDCKSHKTIAALLHTNEDVLMLYSMLYERNIPVNYIIQRQGFNLGDMIELQEFCTTWNDKGRKVAAEDLENKYKNSKNYNLAMKVIAAFDREMDAIENKDMPESEIKSNLEYNGKLHLNRANSFKWFLSDINFDDINNISKKVIVSTIHKAKGMEFDSVHVYMNDDFNNDKDGYKKRLLYVGITRAKEKLYIHANESRAMLNPLHSFAKIEKCEKKYSTEHKVIITMGLTDIVLSNKIALANIKRKMPLAGEKCDIRYIGKYIKIYSKDKAEVAFLSESITKYIEQQKDKGYVLEPECEIAYVVEYTCKDGKFIEVLCNIFMKNKHSRALANG